MRIKWFHIWLVVNLLLLVVPPLALYHSIDATYWHAEATGDWHDLNHTDAINIAGFLFFLLLVCLPILNAIGFCGWKVWKLIRSRL